MHNNGLEIPQDLVSSALGAVTGVSRTKMSEMYNKMGDIGDVAQACRRNQSMLRTPPPLTLQGVLSELRRMSVQGECASLHKYLHRSSAHVGR
eukprot:scaffold144853_cov19-Tisochrysis_lutea.AAC.2